MSKSRGNVVTPMHLLEEYGADAVRYWAASARLGTDTAFDDKVFRIGKRLVTKLFNAGKFVLSQTAPDGPIGAELDRAFAHRLRELVERVTAAFEEFDYAHALQDTETFFWNDFTDTFLELAKGRARDGDPSAVAALRLGLGVLVRLFAPVLPYIAEEGWSWAFAAGAGPPSVHAAPWPGVRDFAAVPPPTHPASFDVAVACFGAINKGKSEAGVSVGRGVTRLALAAAPATLATLDAVRADVMAATRVERCDVRSDPALDGAIRVEALELVP